MRRYRDHHYSTTNRLWVLVLRRRALFPGVFYRLENGPVYYGPWLTRIVGSWLCWYWAPTFVKAKSRGYDLATKAPR